MQQHDAIPSLGDCLAHAPSVTHAILARPAAISGAEMSKVLISLLRLAERAQIAIWRLLRKIK
jgi:hypothetical protein